MKRTGLFLAMALALGVSPILDRAQAATTSDATVRVLSVSPSVPPSTVDVTPLTVVLSITNTSTSTLSQLRLDITREPPISGTDELRRALANPVESRSQAFRLPSMNLDGELAPKATRTVTVSLASSTDSNAANALCLCRTGVYPLDFALHAAGGSVSGSPERGWTQTYIPSADGARTRVSWLWPFIDRPHRLTVDNAFTNDDLAASVASGGRLDRALATLEKVTSLANVTLVIDPELLAELVVMTEGYRVTPLGGGSQTGTGGRVAALWLERFKRVVGASAGYSLTPYGDPDVDALSRAGMSWAATMPQAMTQRLSTLGISDVHDISWPADETITSSALSTLASSGTRAIVLNDATLPDSQASSGGHVTIPNSSVTALTTSRDVATQVHRAVTADGDGPSALPALVASALMPALNETNNFAVLAPDRHVDADPIAAAAAINQTSVGPFLPIAARDALSTVRAYFAGSLTEPSGARDAEIPASMLSTARSSVASSQTLMSALSPTDAATLLAGFPEGLQRAESAAWRTDRSTGQAVAASLAASGRLLGSSIKIVPPPGNSYNLAANDSPLLLTVHNTLTVPVSVKVRVAPVGDVKGFRADDSGVEVIPAGSVVRFRVQAHVERSGHFAVLAALAGPDGKPLGAAERLSIYSKALGTIGIVITVVAGSVLATALLIRFGRRLGNRVGRRRPPSQA